MTDALIKDGVPAGLDVVLPLVAGQWDAGARTVSFAVASVAPGGTTTVTYQALVRADAPLGPISMGVATIIGSAGRSAASADVTGLVLACDSGNVCVRDRCDPAIGCVHETLTGWACEGDGDACTTGTCTAEAVYAEAYLETGAPDACDGIDDDCDGATDEDFASAPVGCGEGVCAVSGTTVCVDGSVRVRVGAVTVDVCLPNEAARTNETCDGRDDDCDGSTDEGFDVGATCVEGRGACERTGTTVCVLGEADCTATPGPTAPETCNDIDDDCDGDTDEAPVCDLDTAFTSGPPARTASTTATFTYIDPPNPTNTRFQCSLDGGPWESCDDGAYTRSGLSVGSHTLLARAVGPTGRVDETPAFWSWVIDTSEPDTTVLDCPVGPVAERHGGLRLRRRRRTQRDLRVRARRRRARAVYVAAHGERARRWGAPLRRHRP